MKLIICIVGFAAMALAEVPVGIDQFNAKLFYQVAKQNTGKSVILSPVSALLPLASLALASVGESHDEIIKAIGVPDDDLSKEVSDLSKQLQSVTGAELRMANRIFVAKDAALNKQFAENSKRDFGLDFKNVDFRNTAAAISEINNWVEDKTHNKIKQLVSSEMVTASTRAILVNAIYFKGTWNSKFEKSLTKDKDFHISISKTVKLPTMSQTHLFQYGESAELDAKLLEMPYEGSETSLLIVLPNQIDGIVNLQEKLKDASLLDKAIKDMDTHAVHVSLPKFKIEAKIDLKNVLQQVGIKKLFTPCAKLKNLLANEPDFSIGGAIQKAYIEVTEEGTEAAAASAFNFIRSAKVLPPVIHKEFVADHPFHFVLKNKSSTLFNGVFIS